MTHPSRIMMLLVVLLAGYNTGICADRMTERDVWHVISSGDVKFGSIHKSVKNLPKGQTRIVSESRMLTELLSQRQEAKTKFDCEVSETLSPLSCSLISESLSGILRATGRVEGEEFIVTLKREKLSFERRFALAEKPVLSVCVPDLLARSDLHRKTRTLNIVDEDSWTLRKATATRLADKNGHQVWKVEFEDSVGNCVWTISADGIVQDAQYKRPVISITKSNEKDSENLAYRKFTDRELLVFPLRKNIAFPERLNSLTVRLRWQGISPDALELQDPHQQVIRQVEKNGHYEVDLRLKRMGEIGSGAGNSSKKRPTDPVWLSSTPYIRPDDPAIAKQSIKWTTGTQTKTEAAKKLVREVSAYLKGGALITESLSGPEVLACRSGKCSEYSTLLASLARAAEIPTRVALGMRLTGGRWVGHMWCEVWVGEWIPVDATVNEFGGSPALLKLTHSDTVMGTQKVRWDISESLELEVIDFEKSSNIGSGLTTGIVQGSYTNADFGCRFTAPADDWKLKDKSKPGVVTIQFQVPGEFEHGKPHVHFVAFGLPTALDPAILVNARKAQFMSTYQDFKVLINEQFPVGKLKGRRFVFRRRTSKKSNRTTKTTEYIWTDGRAGYLLNLIADEAVHDEVINGVEKLLGSFELQQTK